MLKLDNICKTFNPGTINEKKALQNLSLTLKPGDFVTVIGGNGAGKSTMLNALDNAAAETLIERIYIGRRSTGSWEVPVEIHWSF